MMVAAITGGTKTMRAAGPAYLPRNLVERGNA